MPKRSSASPRGGGRRPAGSGARFEAEVLPGLEPFAAAELERLAGLRIDAVVPGAVRFGLGGPPGVLAGLRTVVAVYRLERFDVPRPKALLGDQHFRRLLQAVAEVTSTARFGGFRFGAAGSDSAVFRRLAENLARATGLAYEAEEGELLLRFRQAVSGPGWDVLLRLAPRPLSARAWRSCNLPGGLNATVAAVMNDLLGGRRYLNAMCGSGTLLVERLLDRPAEIAVGCDIEEEALACTRKNLEAAGVREAAFLLRADAARLPFPDGHFDAIAADLPWGDAVGSHRDNARLYPAFLAEARRLLAPAGQLVLLSHEVRLLEQVLAASGAWTVERLVRVFHGGHRPALRLLRPTP